MTLHAASTPTENSWVSNARDYYVVRSGPRAGQWPTTGEEEAELAEGLVLEVLRLEALVNEIATYANAQALDDGDEPGQRDSGYTSNHERGKSDAAHAILHRIAASEAAARG